MKKALVILCMLIFAVGCKKAVKPASDVTAAPETPVQEETLDTEEFVEEVIMPPQEDEITTSTEDILSAEEEAMRIFKDVLFDFDKFNIRPDARPTLNAIASFLNDNRGINIVVEGHCDERGTNEYNLALGEKRAKATNSYLISLGVAQERIIPMTFGEEKPLCEEHNESCWQQNRRAHFALVNE
jgi:peptidoglycan-associated lipoprotein